MVFKNLAVSFFIFFINIYRLQSFPTGAPSSACENMIPQHNVDPIKTENPPFQIIYTPIKDSKNKLEVTIKSNIDGKRFKGFLLQARHEWNGQAIGKWTTQEENTKVIECFDHENSAVTHNHRKSNSLQKNGFTKLTFEWTAPEDFKTINGTILIATVAETSKIIYLNVSNIVKIDKTDVKPVEILRDEVKESAKEEVKENKPEEKKEEITENGEKKEEHLDTKLDEKKEEQKPEINKISEENSAVKQDELHEVKTNGTENGSEGSILSEKKEEEKKLDDKLPVPIEIKEEEFKRPEDVSDKDQEIRRLQEEIKSLKEQLFSLKRNFAE